MTSKFDFRGATIGNFEILGQTEYIASVVTTRLRSDGNFEYKHTALWLTASSRADAEVLARRRAVEIWPANEWDDWDIAVGTLNEARSGATFSGLG